MKEKNKQQRILAVERFNNGESSESICTSLNKSRAWLYKWISRYDDHNISWSESRSRRPKRVAKYTSTEIIEIVKMVRLNLYNQDLFCGAQAIHWEMEELGAAPLP
ncbi:MAG: helix-turn-helix domain-containing protein, partial [Smithella sp.]